jgi:hypothetical protein
MNGKRLTEEFANKVYDILIKEGGATDHQWVRDMFVQSHTSKEPCWEYRFQGHFGFGGKYWSEQNAITYYQEDHTKKLDKLEVKVNKLLKEIK